MATIKAVLLDRDGVLNEKAPDHDYIRKPDQLRLLPGVPEAVRLLNDAGVWALVVTNQRGIARGLMTAADVDAVHAELQTRLKETSNAHLDAFFVCPHGLDDHCACRKPQPGLLLDAMQRYGLEADQCVLIGDSPSDIGAARAAGVRAMRVGTPTQTTHGENPPPDAYHPDLLSAIRDLLGSR